MSITRASLMLEERHNDKVLFIVFGQCFVESLLIKSLI